VPSTAAGLAGWCRNDLWPAARGLAPALGDLHDALVRAGAAPALLCGSGSAIAAIAADDDAARALEAAACRVVPDARMLRARFPGAPPPA
jgi:4-diphosphocytidyl-2C-methyl-D-erythritol kinase